MTSRSWDGSTRGAGPIWAMNATSPSSRPAALVRLRGELAADGPGPDAVLDGTRESLAPLWVGVAARITALEDEDVPFDPVAPVPSHWPSWAATAWSSVTAHRPRS